MIEAKDRDFGIVWGLGLSYKSGVWLNISGTTIMASFLHLKEIHISATLSLKELFYER